MRTQSGHHRLQLSRAQKYIREHLAEKLTLSQLAQISGASRFHFVRVFAAYTAETPFAFVRRQRVVAAMEKLRDSELSISQIGLEVGFGSPSAFTKAFTTVSELTPTEFRTLERSAAQRQYERISQSPRAADLDLDIQLEPVPSLVNRSDLTLVFAEEKGPFEEVAPAAWNRLLASDAIQHATESSEFLGTSHYREGRSPFEVSCQYRAAFTVDRAVASDLPLETMRGGSFARFSLTGPHQHVWPAFTRAFAHLDGASYSLRDAPCLEVYLNNPMTTPEQKLRTDLFIPVEAPSALKD